MKKSEKYLSGYVANQELCKNHIGHNGGLIAILEQGNLGEQSKVITSNKAVFGFFFFSTKNYLLAS